MTEQYQLDLNKRDPNEINNHVQVEFQDVLAEPDGLHSIDCVWSTSYLCFNCGKNCCYKFITTLMGLCIALYWGCEFAMITFDQVWINTPALKCCTIYALCVQRYFGTCVNCCFAPICETCGLLFSRITIIKKDG